MQSQQGPGDKITPKGTFNLLYFLAQCHSTCFSVFTRKNFGVEGLGFNGFGAFIMLILLWGADKTGASMWFFFAWFLALVVQRTRTIKNDRNGIHPHSRYDGNPWFALRFVSRESTAKRVVEPLICFLVGIVVTQFNETLGPFVMMGAMSMTIVTGTDRQIDRIRVQRMRDASMEARHIAAMYRGEDNY